MKFNKTDIIYWINEIGYDPTNLNIYNKYKELNDIINYFNNKNLLTKFFNYCCADIYDRYSSIDEWVEHLNEIIKNVNIKNIIK